MHSDTPWSELPVSQLLDAAPVLAVWVDLEGRVVRINQRVEELSGHSLASVQGQSWCSLFVPSDEQAAVQQTFRAQLHGHDTNGFVHHIRTPSGALHAIEWRNQLIRDSRGLPAGVFSLGIDVTSHRQAAQALSALEQHYEALVTTSPVGVYRGSADALCVFANQRFCDILGITAEEALGDGWIKRLHPDDVGPVFAELDRARRERALFRLEYRFRHPSGEYVWVVGQCTTTYDDQGRVTGYIGTIADVSDMRRTEAALRESEQRYQSLLDQAGHGILLLDREGRVRDCNRRGGDLLGYPVGELVGMRMESLFRPEEPRRRDGGSPASVQIHSNFELRHKQGHYLRTDVRFISLKGGSSLVTVRELLERPKQPEEPRATEARVRAQSRLLDRIFQHTADPLAVLDAQLNLVRISDSFARVNGTWPSRVVGQSLFTYLPSELRPSLEQAQQTKVVYRRSAYPVSGWPGPQEGTSYWDLELVPIVDGSSESDLWFLTLRDVTARIRSEHELLRAERRLAEAQRLAHVGAWELDLSTRALWWSDEMYRINGIAPGEIKANQDLFLGLIPESDRPQFVQTYAHALIAGEWAGDFRIRRPDGELRILHAVVNLIRDKAGNPVALAGANQDVTEQRAAAQRLADSLREKETLLREIHQRVKNNLQVIAGLLYFQAKKAASAAEHDALAEARLRLQAMQLVHEHLYHSTTLSCIDMVAYIQSLVDALTRSMLASENVQTSLSVQPLYLPIESAQPIGMILCELLTNAYRHAFPAGRPGQVAVRAAWQPGYLDLQVEDDGVGLPRSFDPQAAGDFGWQLIRTLVMQLDATLTWVPTPQGTRIAITIPLPDEATLGAR